MTRIRSAISILLGLLLLVQGLSVSAATLVPMSKMTPATAEQTIAMAAPVADAEMPCHQQIAEPATVEKSTSDCPCCDGDCPDMQACAMAHPAMPSALALSLPVFSTAAPAAAEVAISSRSIASPLRPPISLPG